MRDRVCHTTKRLNSLSAQSSASMRIYYFLSTLLIEDLSHHLFYDEKLILASMLAGHF
jgi:hypothetical protein